ncbi:MAG: protein kinase [Polyangiaceae bacterium]
MRERVPARASDSVDLSDTLELLASLTQYAEAGAVQPHTLAQAAKHALEQHGENVDVLFAVAKLYLATGDRGEAGKLLQRASQIAPGDKRASQLMSEAGIELSRHAPITPRTAGALPTSGPRSVREEARPRKAPAPVVEEPQTSSVARPARGESTMRSLAELGALVREEPVEAPRVPDTSPPTTPRSVGPDGPILRPTVRMARVAGAPERGRWGKPSEAREPLDSKPEREPPSENPRSERANPARADRQESPRSQRPRMDSAPGPTSVRTPRQGVAPARSSRAATGNLKLLDPTDERRRLDRYELIGEIAAGGMASVFLARAAGVAGFQRFFAIKRLHPHLADEQEFIDMFLDEARLAAGIHHPNVVPILEVGTTDAGYYLVMDYIEGDTLSGVIARSAVEGGLPRPIALRIILDALHGLHAAHELTDAEGNPVDLVHRDCSPQNILVGIDGSSRLTDFGVARASSRLSTTRSATVKGKLAYLSPEQATGRDLDRRSDLFGMGVILWEVLAGRRLFRADSDGATLSRILVEPIPLLSDHAPDIPAGLADATMKSLARDPADRHPTAADMADAIEQAIRDEGDPQIYAASPREVASYMREMFGADVAVRRDTVRAWIAKCGDADAASGPRSQAPRRGAQVSPSSAHGRPRDGEPSSESEPRSSSRDSSDPVSYGNEPPSSKTEPSAVHAEEAAALSAAAKKAADVKLRDASGAEEPPAEESPSLPVASPSPPPAEAKPKPSNAPPAMDRRKHLPIPLIVFAIVLVVLALATYVSGRRAGHPASGGVTPAPSGAPS